MSGVPTFMSKASDVDGASVSKKPLGHFAVDAVTSAVHTRPRIFTLDSDGSTLRLLLAPTDTTGVRLNGTWTILGGTGVFAGATGTGELWAIPTGAPEFSDTAHSRGTITLPA